MEWKKKSKPGFGFFFVCFSCWRTSGQSWVTAKQSKSSACGWAWTGKTQFWGGTTSAKGLHPLPNANIATPEDYKNFSCVISFCFWNMHFLRTDSDSRWEQSQVCLFKLRENTFPFPLWLYEEIQTIKMWWKLALKKEKSKQTWNGISNWKGSFLYSF